MVKHTQTIRRQIACLSVFDHFVGLALKGLKNTCKIPILRLGGSVKLCPLLFSIQAGILCKTKEIDRRYIL